MPVVIVVFFAAIMSSYALGLSINQAQEAPRATNDVRAVNVWSYHDALVSYRRATPGATGTIGDGVISLPDGMVRNTNWTNEILDGRLWVYEVNPSGDFGVLGRLSDTSAAHGVFVGRRTAGANLTTATGYDTGIPVPSGIALGAIAIVSR